MSAEEPEGATPRYEKQNELLRPADYRQWVFLSSGFGMSYSPGDSSHPLFTNVFVPQSAYRAFLKSGRWPDKTMFVVEERGSASGGVTQAGHYQSEVVGLGVEVKDEARFPDKWAYFSFGEGDASASVKPRSACWQCHEDHAAVEHTFVQFYPTLKPVGEKFGTYRQR